MNCAICQQPMRLVPAGVSKATGKPYSAFWACNDRTHKQPKTNGFSPKPEQKPDWDKIRNEKAEDIRSNVALKGAIDLIASGKIDKDSWEEWANVFYNYTPNINNPF